MARRTKIAMSSLAATALGLAVAACQPQMAVPTVQETAAPTGGMTVAEVQELIVGNTVFVRSEANRVSRAEYFSADGTVKMKAKPDFMNMAFSFEGTYLLDDQEGVCFNYPTLPVDPKEYCENIVESGDGGYALTDGGIVERILDGDQLDELE